MADSAQSDRWSRHPVAARVLRALVALAPVLSGVAAAAMTIRLLPLAPNTPVLVVQWILVVAVSLAVAYAVDRGARRMLPLAFLLDLSLLFPDRAPSRFGIALRAGSTRELARLRDDAADALEPEDAAERILALTSAIGTHDRYTRGHSERVRAYAELIGEQLDLDDHDLERLRWAALLHDVGKLEVPRNVLNKDQDPDPEEWELLHRHPEEGARLAEPLLPWLGEWGAAIEQHHERFDGHGYPAGLSGEAISLSGRIVAVADAYETMVSPRPYKSALSHPKARRELVRCAGTDFDPAVVRAFLSLSARKLLAITGPLVALLDLPLLRHLGTGAQMQAAGAATVVAVGAVATVGLVSPVATSSSDRPDVGVDAPGAAPAEEPLAPLIVDPSSPVPSPSPSPSPTASPSGTSTVTSSTGDLQVSTPGEAGEAVPDSGGGGTPEQEEEFGSTDTGSATTDAEERGQGRGSPPEPPPHASADPDPDTESGGGASPRPRDG